jgi:hypothetical protein
MTLSLPQTADYYRTMALEEPDAPRRKLWIQLADDIDDYLAGPDDSALPVLL